MADLKHNNDCLGCEHYESDANDYYYEWCHHPNIEDEDEEGNYLYQEENGGDLSFFVNKCPVSGEPVDYR